MVFLRLQKVDENKAKIMLIHNFPDMLTEEEKKDGVLIDEYIERPGLPYWDYNKKEVFFEKKEEQKNNDELQKQIDELTMALASQMGGVQ